ncbi:hypothetical protein [Flavivirga eckloniae]|uniref:Serine protease n=1 Tax=Flavivirga eckloniae TaxID=1803846 RepID=A0A2K9PW06_9FLAO|nr:hypothetical protein [Flavivirga eckloniae]AUP81018.1 hypothetical protein C1H87_20790 [Flavivirga eckloniae]
MEKLSSPTTPSPLAKGTSKFKNMKYMSQKEANEVLEFYENRLMSIDDVTYAAVVENTVKTSSGEENFGYKLEIGTSSKEIVIIDSSIKPFNAYIGNWGENKIPEYLPVPSEYRQYLNYSYKIKSKKNSNYNLKIKNNRFSSQVYVKKIEFRDYEYKKQSNLNNRVNDPLLHTTNGTNESDINTDKKWIDYALGGQPIKTESGNPGTLGGVFQLLEFPNKLFGISNWHVIAGKTALLGQDTYSYGDNVVRGELFWHNMDIEREVGFISFNNETVKEYRLKYGENNLMWTVEAPKIGMPVFQNGYGRGKNKSVENEGKIISINATIKNRDPLFPNKIKIFRHQLLIERIHNGGDSGALVFKKKNDDMPPVAIGLLFAEEAQWIAVDPDSQSTTRCFSVANNLSRIFNYSFPLKQEVYKRTETGPTFNGDIHTSLIDRFTLSENLNLDFINNHNQ